MRRHFTPRPPSERELFKRGKDAAERRLAEAKNLCDAVAGQDLVIQAEATIDAENALAVASEWGLVRMGPGL